jgi:hypothetical protein
MSKSQSAHLVRVNEATRMGQLGVEDTQKQWEIHAVFSSENLTGAVFLWGTFNIGRYWNGHSFIVI